MKFMKFKPYILATAIAAVALVTTVVLSSVSISSAGKNQEAIYGQIDSGNIEAAKESINNGLVTSNLNEIDYLMKSKQAFENGSFEDGLKYLVEAGGKANVTFMPNGGTVSHADMTISTYPYSNSASKQGFTFTGWKLSTYTMDSKNKTVTAKVLATYNAINYTITYNLNGGVNSTNNPSIYNVNSQTIYLENPQERFGYSFDCWTNKSGTKVISIPSGSIGNVVLNANWIENQYYVAAASDNMDQGTVIGGNSKYKIGQQVTLKAQANNGYAFDYWLNVLTNEKLFTEEIVVKCIAKDQTFTAYFRQIQYSISYNLNGGDPSSNTNPTSYVCTETVALEPVRRTGYYFMGWYNNDEMIEEIAGSSCTNYSLEALWSCREYHINYELNGGINDDRNLNYYSVENVITFADPTKEGYVFGGWYRSSDFEEGTKLTSTFNLFLDELTVYAKWDEIPYSITYNLDGGINSELNPESYTVNDEVVFENPTKIGYTFEGWTDSFGDTVTFIECGTTGDLELFANWSLITYDIVYELYEGTNSESNPSEYDAEEIVVFEDPTKAGCDFGGWYLDNEFTTQIIDTEGYFQDLTLYAKWDEISYSITYHLDGGENSIDNPETYTASTDLMLNNPTKFGYTFEKWTNSQGRTITNIGPGSTGDIELFANWSLNTYSISYDPREGDYSSNPTSYTVEDNVTFNEAYLSGHVFAGWYMYVGQEYTLIQSTDGYAESMYLTAEYVVGGHIYYYNLEDGANSENNYGFYDLSNVRTIEEATRDGYVFIGWVDSSGNPVTQTPSEYIGDLNLYAVWEPITYSITYELDGGENSIDNPSEYSRESTVYFEPASKEGLIFDGWYLDDTFETKIENTEGLTGDLVLYANYCDKWYEIDTNYGSYGFYKDESINPNTSLYDGVYYSNNYGLHSTRAVAKVTFCGYSSFTVYIRSYAESGCDYTIASTLDAPSYPTSYSDYYAKTSTSSSQTYGTSISSYTAVTYSGLDGGEHYFYIVYRKDGSVNSGNDRGYFIIPLTNE